MTQNATMCNSIGLELENKHNSYGLRSRRSRVRIPHPAPGKQVVSERARKDGLRIDCGLAVRS